MPQRSHSSPIHLRVTVAKSLATEMAAAFLAQAQHRRGTLRRDPNAP